MKNSRVVVVGMGASGIAAARLCLARGARVVGIDRKSEKDLGDAIVPFLRAGGALAPESERDARVNEADLVVVSPGVPSFPALDAAAQRGVPVIGEVELAVRELASKAAPLVAVGGTNGKSTTTTLVADLIQAAGKRTFAGGNLGEPLALHVDEPWDAVVLEVSSFQMERVETFRPRVSVLLNVTPDHLDRYPSFEAYADAKGNSFLRQTPEDAAVIPFGDEICLRQAKRGQGRIITFGPGGDVDVAADAIVHRPSGERFARRDMRLQGSHNALNVAAALACAFELGVSAVVARKVLSTFEGLAHRMALVAEIAGVRYYDDSKGTNVGATVTALRGIAEPRAVLVAGGVDKGGSYEPLVEALVERGRAAVLIGQAAPLIEAAVAGRIPVKHAGSMDEAVRISHELAQSGDAVLLSPACSSFDMFRDYKDRGDAFVRAVKALASSHEEKRS